MHKKNKKTPKRRRAKRPRGFFKAETARKAIMDSSMLTKGEKQWILNFIKQKQLDSKSH